MTITPETARLIVASVPGHDHRWEITPEGNLVIMSPANSGQSKIVGRLTEWFVKAGIPGSQLLPEVGIPTIAGGVRGPDLAVFAEEPEEAGPWVAIDALRIVIEVLSPSTRRTDERDKADEYAAAGIGRYWLVDPLDNGDATVHMYELEPAARRYRDSGAPVLLSSLITHDARAYVYYVVEGE
jgi:Uma2 family endonuclease